MLAKKERLDVILTERGLFETREKAKRAIMEGIVFSKEERLDKPGVKVPVDIEITIKGKKMPYVSRGGYKLEKALKVFDLKIKDKVMIDIGSSTGGFTDCALQNGVKYSYAIDVGYNQLAWKLRSDERVIVMERTNFRYIKPEDLERDMPQFASIDVSFISLKLMLPPLKKLLVDDSDVVALIKPQFEAGRDLVGKKGIVRDPKVHIQVIEDIIAFALSEGYDVKDLTFSPITGGEGNIEFLIHLKWHVKEDGVEGTNFLNVPVKEVVQSAHEQLKEGKTGNND
ncbi:TlyA family RNA methyltransferase [Pallidibacillus pasinlerensis]|uniref:TlyA family RNA methyltransferase n=1 Tax=Pallidibacillus pasinlerensis TaxID=2703818 RepID=A0ABX0A038_9BACI|nr:TlyA family RNA methyltransferase [Pallidibacillus pasinlerensis]NCU16774.1 TlyA family RNA methyltransferase [Pallidibacillus pasinlerensis]